MNAADLHSPAIAIASTSTSLDLAFPFELRMAEIASVFPSSPSNFDTSKRRQNPRKKRSRIGCGGGGSGSGVSKPKYSKKPDPRSPKAKITPPCTECGKKFWSDKALFGHMRCHPERQWRGINPPINLVRRPISVSPITEEEQDIADCLIMLANSPNIATDKVAQLDDVGTTCRFECSSCKKVFGSHQALGGHRASHKNVKGCFAMARGDEETEEFQFQNAALFGHERDSNLEDKMSMFLGLGHKCSICMRVFASGQALGGHKRCHWERVEESTATEGCANLDLNLPPAPVEDDSCSSYSSRLTLDLRLEECKEIYRASRSQTTIRLCLQWISQQTLGSSFGSSSSPS